LAVDEAFRIKGEGTCTRCHRDVRGWIAFSKTAQVVNSEGFVVFEDGLVCDSCSGEIPLSGGY